MLPIPSRKTALDTYSCKKTATFPMEVPVLAEKATVLWQRPGTG